MQNPIPKFIQSSIISEKNRLFVWKIDNFDKLKRP